jgi:YVTN family beta-propeller protein
MPLHTRIIRGYDVKKYLLILLFGSVLISGCQTFSLQMRAPLVDEGVVYLYSKPFPQEAGKLSFALESIQAIGENGKNHELTISLPIFSAKEAGRQRLVASGPLPPGAYSGFSFKFKAARLRSEEGDVALSVPETSIRLSYPFRVQRKKGLVLSMALQYGESLQNGVIFNPTFSFILPDKPLISLMGFVSDSDSNSVMVFDKYTKEVTNAIVVGQGPRGMALSQTRNRVFVALSGEDAIAAIDVANSEVLAEIRMVAGDKPNELALTPDEKTLYVPNSGSDTVSIIDAGTLIEVERLKVGIEPRAVTIDKAGRRAYVCNAGSSTLSVIDVNSKTIIATLVTEPKPLRSRFNRNGDKLYIISEDSPYILVLDPATLAVLRREFVGRGSHSIKVDTKTDLIYIGKKFGAEFSVYDPFTWVPVDYVRTMGPVEYGTIDDETNNLYSSLPENRMVSVINLTNRKPQTDFDLAGSPFWITLYGER